MTELTLEAQTRAQFHSTPLKLKITLYKWFRKERELSVINLCGLSQGFCAIAGKFIKEFIKEFMEKPLKQIVLCTLLDILFS